MSRIEALDRELGRERIEVLPLSELDEASRRIDLEIELRDPSRPPPDEDDGEMPRPAGSGGEDERPNRLVPDLAIDPLFAPPPAMSPGSRLPSSGAAP
jgi:hypothetical protein